MSSEPQLYRINPETRESEQVKEVNFRDLGFQERRHIQEWIASNPDILGEELLIISKEYSGFDRTNERLDLLAVDSDGKLVVIELKRDDSGTDVHWQAIKYASYCHHADSDRIISLMAKHKDISPAEATNQLLQHLGADDFGSLNNDQRIILVSHRFAPEVTSAVLWLNEKAPGENLITCIKLTPFRDSKDDSLYIQASTIIPIPGTKDFTINIADDGEQEDRRLVSSLGAKLTETFAKHKNDKITRFLRKMGALVLQGLPHDIRPNRISRWGGRHNWPGGEYWRYYHFWYAHAPWGNWRVDYRVNVWPQGEKGWGANVEFRHNLDGLQDKLAGIVLGSGQLFESNGNGITVQVGNGEINDDTNDDDKFANRIAEMTQSFIKEITPIVDELENEGDETEALVSLEGEIN